SRLLLPLRQTTHQTPEPTNQPIPPAENASALYDTQERPKAFSMDSLEFFFLIAQYFREALPLRLILLMIACQKAGGQIRLTQEEMSTVLDVHRGKINEALGEVMSHGIVFKVCRGVYQFNPPYSYRVAEFIPGTELVEAEYVQVDQDKTIRRSARMRACRS
ncbi:hypothetical protein ACFWNO_47530, partial [Streptomyces sp. NPDC058394]